MKPAEVSSSPAIKLKEVAEYLKEEHRGVAREGIVPEAVSAKGEMSVGAIKSTSESQRAKKSFFGDSVRARFVAVAFLILNFFLYKLLLSTVAEGAVKADFQMFGNCIFALLTLCAAAAEINSRFSVAIKSLAKIVINRSCCEVLALLALLGQAGIVLYQGGVDTLSSFYFEPLLLLVGVFALYGFIENRVYQKLEQLSKPDVSPHVSLLSVAELSGAELSDSEQPQSDSHEENDIEGLMFDLENTTICPSSKLQEGDLFLIEQGQCVPVDSFVLQGIAFVKHFSYDSLSSSVIKTENTELPAGSILLDGSLVCRARGSVDDSELSFFVDHVKLVQNNALESEDDDKAGKLANFAIFETWYHFLLLFVAGTTSIYWHQHGESLQFILGIFAAFMCLSAVPKIMMYHIAKERCIPMSLFRRGLVYLDSGFWRKLAAISKVYVRDEPTELFMQQHVKDFVVLDQRVDFSKCMPLIAQLVYMANDADVSVFHKYFKTKNIQPQLSSFDNFFLSPGRGARANIHGAEIIIGTEDYLLQHRVTIQRSDIADEHINLSKRFIAIGSLPVAYFVFEKSKASDTSHFMRRLNELPLKKQVLSMLSKDELSAKSKTMELGEAVSIKGIHGLVEVAQKASEVEEESLFVPLSKTESFQIPQSDRVSIMGVFDALEYNLFNFDATVVRKNLQVVPEVISYCRKLLRSQKVSFGLTVFVTAALFAGVLLVNLAAWKVALCMLLSLTVLYMYENYVLE